MEKIQNYINGKLVEPQEGKYIDNINPAEGKVYSLIPDSDAKDVEQAVEAAKKAFHDWSTMPVNKRSDILVKIADLIDRDLDKLALAESIDQGKPVKLARVVGHSTRLCQPALLCHRQFTLFIRSTPHGS
jgi:aminomuconate-semialdehyde/2-hydroxymuconate-6-semialdehyde dehydrogenase